MIPIRILIAAAALPLALGACGRKGGPPRGGNPMDQPQSVEVMPVEVMALTETTGLVGSIAANESAELRTEYPGTVTGIAFEEGSVVKKDQLLVQLDTRELEAQLAQQKASAVLAGKTLERKRSLLGVSAVSQLEVDAAEAEHARLSAAVKQLEIQLAKASVRAPFDGVAGARSISVGDYVTPQAVITTVDDLSRLKIEMEAPERYLPLLQPGSSFSLRAATFAPEQSCKGEVYFVSSRIDEASRSILVKGLVTDPPAKLKPGMFADVTLVLREVKDALVVPEASVLSTPRGTVLIKPVEKEGATVASFVPVRLGIRVPGRVQVIPVGPPLLPGDKVVSAGVGGLILFPDRKLKPVEPIVTPEMPEKTDRKLER